MWHRLLIFLGIRNEFDWAEACLGPEVPHPYVQHSSLQCCEHCGGGRLNRIHRPPYNTRRMAEILGASPPRPDVLNNPPYPMQGRPQSPGSVRSYIEREHGR